MSRVLPRATLSSALLAVAVLTIALLCARADRADAAQALDVDTWAATQGTPVPGAYVVADPGTWEAPGPTTTTYQWLRDGAPIAGATEQQYVVSPADVGHQLAPQVTGSRDGYSSDTFVGTALLARPITTSVELQVRRAYLPGKHRKVWVAQAAITLERPWSDEGTVSITKLRHGTQKLLATGTSARGVALVRLPWKNAPQGTSTLTACFSGTTALAPSCSATEKVRG